ncbi:MAG: BlaI/MecI/CopY family transcriptional regulator [Sedimentisphaerales bacterium]|nr:BlaI/MecI/CopY family transcriptional regulator [Sedimentisphaerales bacterium]
MRKKALDDLGELQRTVLEIIWQMGEASVHQVRDRLIRKKKRAYTTVLSAMQKLEKAGWLKHRTEGRIYVYLPTRTREQAGAKSVRRFLKRVFQDDAVALLQHLIYESDLDAAELSELRRMIEQKEKEQEDGKS